MVSLARKQCTRSKEIDLVITGLLSEEMASNLIRVKEAGSSKLRMTQVQGWVAKGSRVEVKDAMVKFGWQMENGPGASQPG